MRSVEQDLMTHSQRRALRRNATSLAAEYHGLFPSVCNGDVPENMQMGEVMKRVKTNPKAEIERLEPIVQALRSLAYNQT